MIKRGLLYIFCLFLIVGYVSAADYYVSPTGTASWSSCTNINTPCSLSTANSNAKAGDLVVFKDGDYGTALNPSNSGTSGNPIIFQSLYEWSGGSSGTKYGPDLNSDTAINLNNGQDYMIIDGIEVDNANTYFIDAEEADDIEVRNCRFDVKEGMNAWSSIEIGTGCDHWLFHDNIVVQQVGQSKKPGNGNMFRIVGTGGTDPRYNYVYDNIFINGRDHDFMTIDNGAYNVVYKNTFYTDGTQIRDPDACVYSSTSIEDCVPHEFIVLSISSYGNVVEGNTFFEMSGSLNDGYPDAIHSLNAYNNIIRGNLMYNMDHLAIELFSSPAWYRHANEYNRVYHNTFYNTNIAQPSWFKGIVSFNCYEGSQDVPGEVRYNKIANNIFHTSSVGYAIYKGYDDDPGGNVYPDPENAIHDNEVFGNWFYNIFQDKEIRHTIAPTPTEMKSIMEAERDWGSVYYDNYYPNPNPADGTDPKLTDPANGDMTLQSTSGCIDKAEPLTLTSGSGSGSNKLVVDDSYFFQSLGGIEGWNSDKIYVKASNPFSVPIISIDHSKNELTLASSHNWEDNVEVYWCPQGVCFSGSAPDIGAVEYSGITCTESWTCTAWSSWSSCVNSIQTRTRTCTDQNNCGTTVNKPAETETQSCSLPANSYTILKTSTPPFIDGNLNEFTNANEITVTNSRGNSATYKILWDSNSLYLAAQVNDDQLAALVNTRDGNLWEDDSIELFFDTLNNGGATLNSDDYKFFVNLKNTQRDNSIGGGGVSWNTAFSSQVKNTGTLNTPGDADTIYTIEIAIPWIEWATPNDDDVWGFDVNMNDKRDDGSIVWKAWSQSSRLNLPDEFGDIIFSSAFVIPSSQCGSADKDNDGVINISELISYINDWKVGIVGISDLMDVIGKWKNGC